MNDKLQHFLICAAIAAVMAAVMRLTGATVVQTAIASVDTSMAAGLGKEYGDRCAIGNHWDWVDLAADLAGAVVGTVVVIAAEAMIRIMIYNTLRF